MNDARGIEQSTTKDLDKTVITVGQDFSYFNQSDPQADDDEIVQYSDIKYLQDKTSVGVLIGRAKSLRDKKISADDLLQLTFEIKSNATIPSSGAPEESAKYRQGLPLDKPVMLVKTTENGLPVAYASVGTTSGQNLRSILFTHWMKVSKENRMFIIKRAQGLKPQPKSFTPHELMEAKYKLV